MIDITGEADYKSLYELRQRRDSGRKTLARVSEELDCILSEVKTKTEMLKSLNTEYAVTERQIKDSKNEISFLKERCSAIYNGFTLLHMEFVKGKEQLTGLQNEKGILNERIVNLEKGINEASSLLSTQENEKQGLLKEVGEKNEEKQKISDEISELLSETSLEREQIEQQIMELNDSFIDQIGRRNDAQKLLSEREDSIRGLKKSVEDLERQVDLLEQLKKLQNDRNTLRDFIEKLQLVRETFGVKLAEAGNELELKQDEFDDLSQTNEELQEKIEIIEKEVSEYGETIKAKNRAQEENDITSESNRLGLGGLMELFTGKTKLETSLLMMEEKIKAIAGLVES